MKKIKIKAMTSKRIKQGYPLIKEDDLVHPNEGQNEMNWVQFVSQNNEFLGLGYLGAQNKGAGWVLTTENISNVTLPFFVGKFEKANEKRVNFANQTDTTAYRMVNGEGDGLGGLTVDRYNQYVVFSWYNETIYKNKQLLIDAFKEANPGVKGAYEKIRFKDDKLPESQHLYGEEAPEPLLIKENGVTFATYLNEGLMTGIFLDQKDVRGRLVDGMAQGMSVLNTFSYTGAFSVAAAMGGAAETTSVDLAKRSLPKTQEMFEVNGLSLENNRIVVMDVFDYFNYAKRKKLNFDMIILDPPSFARNKKRTFSVAKNYGELVAEVSELLTPNGWLIASTNAANVSLEKYQQMVEKALTEKGKGFKKQDSHRLPGDFVIKEQFTEGNYLKVLVYQIFS